MAATPSAVSSSGENNSFYRQSPKPKTSSSVSSRSKRSSTSTTTEAAPQAPRRTIEDVRSQVAYELSVRTSSKAQILDGTKINVVLTYSKKDDITFLRKVADCLRDATKLRDQPYLYALATTMPSGTKLASAPDPAYSSPTTDSGYYEQLPSEPREREEESSLNYIVFCGSSPSLLERATLLTSAKFINRIESKYVEKGERVWIAGVRDMGRSIYDEEALWDIVRKSARAPLDDPYSAPPGSKGIEQILSEARAKLQRITPVQAYNELQDPLLPAPTFLVDIRPAAQREQEGTIQGSVIIERNVLEWRLDPRSSARLKMADRYDLRIIVFCSEGYTSSLAAFALQEIGQLNATDIVGGYKAWKEAGLPVVHGSSMIDAPM